MLSSRSNCSTWTCQATVQQPASMLLASNTEWSRGGCGTLLVQCSTEQLTSRPCTSDAHSVTISPLLPACFSFRLRLQLGECCHWTRHTSTAVCLCSDWIRPGKVPVVPHEVFQCTNPHTPRRRSGHHRACCLAYCLPSCWAAHCTFLLQLLQSMVPIRTRCASKGCVDGVGAGVAG